LSTSVFVDAVYPARSRRNLQGKPVGADVQSQSRIGRGSESRPKPTPGVQLEERSARFRDYLRRPGVACPPGIGSGESSGSIFHGSNRPRSRFGGYAGRKTGKAGQLTEVPIPRIVPPSSRFRSRKSRTRVIRPVGIPKHPIAFRTVNRLSPASPMNSPSSGLPRRESKRSSARPRAP